MAETWRALEDRPDSVGAPAATADAPRTDAASAGRWWLVLLVGIGIAAAAAAWLLASGTPAGNLTVNAAYQPATPASASSHASGGGSAADALASDTPALPVLLVIDVNGAVQRPGVYQLPEGSRVGDAIRAAGGFGPHVDARGAQALNLAAKVGDGQQVHVPSRDERASSGSPGVNGSVGGTAGAGGASAAGAGPVDLNRATSAELEALPGIGPATAARIIAARGKEPFRSVDDLKSRKVLGQATLDKIRDLVTVR